MGRHSISPNALDLPMPFDRWGGAIVVASCWRNDTKKDGDITFTLMLLYPSPPFYTVIEFNVTRFKITMYESFPNIIPTAEFYEEMIGGY